MANRTRRKSAPRRMSRRKTATLEVSLEEQRRRQLVAAVVACVTEEGFESATMRNIAERAGVSTGLLNYYFKNKRELVTAAIQRATLGVSSALAEDKAVPYGPRRLEHVVRRSMRGDYPQPLPLSFRLQILAAAAYDPQLQRVISDWMEYGRASFQKSIEAGIANGQLRSDLDPALLSVTLYGAMTGLAVEAVAAGDRLSVERAIDATLLIVKLLEPAAAAPTPVPLADSLPQVVEKLLLQDAHLSPARALGLAAAFRSMYESVTTPAAG